MNILLKNFVGKILGLTSPLQLHSFVQTNDNLNLEGRRKGYEIMAMACRGAELPSNEIAMDVVRTYVLRTRLENSEIGGLSFVIFHSLLLKTPEERSKLSILSVDDLQFAKSSCQIPPKSSMGCKLEQVLRYESYQRNPLSLESPLALLSLNSWTPTFLTLCIDICQQLGGE